MEATRIKNVVQWSRLWDKKIDQETIDSERFSIAVSKVVSTVTRVSSYRNIWNLSIKHQRAIDAIVKGRWKEFPLVWLYAPSETNGTNGTEWSVNGTEGTAGTAIPERDCILEQAKSPTDLAWWHIPHQAMVVNRYLLPILLESMGKVEPKDCAVVVMKDYQRRYESYGYHCVIMNPIPKDVSIVESIGWEPEEPKDPNGQPTEPEEPNGQLLQPNGPPSNIKRFTIYDLNYPFIKDGVESRISSTFGIVTADLLSEINQKDHKDTKRCVTL